MVSGAASSSPHFSVGGDLQTKRKKHKQSSSSFSLFQICFSTLFFRSVSLQIFLWVYIFISFASGGRRMTRGLLACWRCRVVTAAGGCSAGWLWVLDVEMAEESEAAALLWCSSGQGKGQALAGFGRRKREKTPKISEAVTVLMTGKGKSGEVDAGCVWSASSRKKIAGAKIGVRLQCRKWGEDGALWFFQKEGRPTWFQRVAASPSFSLG
jgi:hypothetical protein